MNEVAALLLLEKNAGGSFEIPAHVRIEYRSDALEVHGFEPNEMRPERRSPERSRRLFPDKVRQGKIIFGAHVFHRLLTRGPGNRVARRP